MQHAYCVSSVRGVKDPARAQHWWTYRRSALPRGRATIISNCHHATLRFRRPLSTVENPDNTRRGVAVSLLLSVACGPAFAASADEQLMEAFRAAMAASDLEAADAAWTQAIRLAPTNAPALSNRGTVRLQAGRWQEARDDLQRAIQLEEPGAPGYAAELNNLGNAEGALGNWSAARLRFAEAAEDPAMESIAMANLALASWEVGDSSNAIKEARQLLRRDGSFLDMRCALTAFLYATGSTAEAEGAWEELQNSNDGLGAAIYSRSLAVSRVQGRWPPRATAALKAFLSMSDTASAASYDGSTLEYRFSMPPLTRD